MSALESCEHRMALTFSDEATQHTDTHRLDPVASVSVREREHWTYTRVDRVHHGRREAVRPDVNSR
jgi:hypothetical protein